LSQSKSIELNNIPFVLFILSIVALVTYSILNPSQNSAETENIIHFGIMIKTMITLVQEPIISIFQLVIIFGNIGCGIIVYKKIKQWRSN
jgi:hypothetical protein